MIDTSFSGAAVFHQITRTNKQKRQTQSVSAFHLFVIIALNDLNHFPVAHDASWCGIVQSSVRLLTGTYITCC